VIIRSPDGLSIFLFPYVEFFFTVNGTSYMLQK
jgi:hypothetical protein